MAKKVVITSEFFGRFSNEAGQLLEENGLEVVPNPYQKFLSEEETISIIGKADAVICDLEKITKRVIDSAPHLKIIARRGVGTDSVDVNYAEEKGIIVARTPGVVERPVAELVMAYILQIYRKIGVANQAMKEGKWQKILGNSLEGKVLGIVGLGNIGRELVRKARAFDLQVVYTDHRRKEELEQKLKIDFLDWEQFLARSDIISLHLPLTPQTENMINYQNIKLMKKRPVLINTARGQVINQGDLVRALNEDLISFAAIDVFDQEPKTDSPLRKFDNVILTPHIGTFTREVFIKMDLLAARNIIEYFSLQEN